MIVWSCKPELLITSDIEPVTVVRKPLPSDSKEERKDKKDYPYLNKRDVTFTVDYLGTIYVIYIHRGFKWDGSSCPGLHHIPSLLNASMVHDIICNYHELVSGDRQLSTMIFRELGIASGMNKVFMYGAYHCVDNYQKIFGKDLKGRKWNEF